MRKSWLIRVVFMVQAALLGTLAVMTAGFGVKSAPQTNSQPISLFKVPYGEHPTHLRMRFPGFWLVAVEGEERYEEPLPGGGPTSFCVSWDGQLFYIADPLRNYDKNLDLPPEDEVSPSNKDLVPWVQVYNRQGQWVRTIKLEQGFPSRIRVDEQGWLYVDDVKQGVAVYRPDGTYDSRRTQAIADAIRRAETEHNLDPKVAKAEFFEVDRFGRTYFIVHQIISEEGSTKILRARLLVVNPDGSFNLLDCSDYRQWGIDRYRGELIIGDYDTPAEGQMEVQFVVHPPDDEESTETPTITLYKKEPYKCVRPNGEVVRRFDWWLDISDRVPNVWDGFVETVNLEMHLAIATDEAGRLYRVYTNQQRHWVFLNDPEDSDRKMRFMDGFWIIEFTSEGRFVRPRASNLRLIGSYGHLENLVGRIINLWDVDKHGNVYWMEFHPRHVEIKMSPR